MSTLNTAKTLWISLPESIRNASGAQWLKERAKTLLGCQENSPPEVLTAAPVENDTRPNAHIPPGAKLIKTLEELDVMLKKLDEMAAVSDDELRKGFQMFYMEFPLELPEDPDCSEYRDVQMRFYEWLHGKPYSVQNEIDPIDIDAMASRPFPFTTESPQTVGNQIMAIGHLIKTMDLGAASKVLEFGPGWGNTTVWLARMGYKVTAVDINENFLNLIKRRAANKNLQVDTVTGDFSKIDQLDKKFDAILFFECFHHCANHHELIAKFDQVLAPGGKVIFAAEPISNAFPIPWGLRLDGEAVWAIRKNGWLEL